MPRLGRFAVVLACCGLVALPGAALGSWSVVLDLNAHPRATPELVGDRAGGAVLAWVDFADGGPGVPMEPSAKGLLKAVRRASGDVGFGAVEMPAGRSSNVRVVSSASDGAGGIGLAWRAGENSSDAKLRVAIGTTQRGLDEPVTLSGLGVLPRSEAQPGGDPNARPAVAISRHGEALVAWLARARSGCGYLVRASVRTAGGRFSRGRAVSASCGRAANPRVALGPDGSGAIAWDAGPNCPAVLRSCAHEIITLRVTAGRIGQRAAVTRRAAPYAPALAIGENGPIYAWTEFLASSGSSFRGKPYARVTDTSGRLRERQALSRSASAGTPRLVVGKDESVLATWQSGGRDNPGPVQISLRPPGARAFPAAESFPGRGLAGAFVASLQAGLSDAADAAVIHCDGYLRLVFSQRRKSGTLPAPELVGGTDAIAGSLCPGVSPAPLAAIAVAGDGATLVSAPGFERIRVVQRPAPIG